MRTAILVVVGLLILAGVIVIALVLAARNATREAARNTFDAVFRVDSAGRYPGEAGWVDEAA